MLGGIYLGFRKGMAVLKGAGLDTHRKGEPRTLMSVTGGLGIPSRGTSKCVLLYMDVYKLSSLHDFLKFIPPLYFVLCVFGYVFVTPRILLHYKKSS